MVRFSKHIKKAVVRQRLLSPHIHSLYEGYAILLGLLTDFWEQRHNHPQDDDDIIIILADICGACQKIVEDLEFVNKEPMNIDVNVDADVEPEDNRGKELLKSILYDIKFNGKPKPPLQKGLGPDTEITIRSDIEQRITEYLRDNGFLIFKS